MALCLTGLGLGDPPLMILSLCSLALSYILSFFSFLSLYTLSSPFVFFSLPHVFLHKVVFLNINLCYLSKKKKKKKNLRALRIECEIGVGIMEGNLYAEERISREDNKMELQKLIVTKQKVEDRSLGLFG